MGQGGEESKTGAYTRLMRRTTLIPLLLGLATSGPLQATEVYRWVDDNGVIHFSQSAPRGGVGQVEKMTLDDLIADTRRGILIDGSGSFSIDNRRLNFQFGGDAFWEIKNGKKTHMLRDVTYQSITPKFWGSCNAACDEREWQPYGTFYCGKGDPMQTSQISHKCVPARFQRIKVRRAG